ncbi:MAG: hypothetical protein HY722_06890 [Planctomycetes bacterium]|nr:hypothetical protein [Planctomycetota bacterium]
MRRTPIEFHKCLLGSDDYIWKDFKEHGIVHVGRRDLDSYGELLLWEDAARDGRAVIRPEHAPCVQEILDAVRLHRDVLASDGPSIIKDEVRGFRSFVLSSGSAESKDPKEDFRRVFDEEDQSDWFQFVSCREIIFHGSYALRRLCGFDLVRELEGLEEADRRVFELVREFSREDEYSVDPRLRYDTHSLHRKADYAAVYPPDYWLVHRRWWPGEGFYSESRPLPPRIHSRVEARLLKSRVSGEALRRAREVLCESAGEVGGALGDDERIFTPRGPLDRDLFDPITVTLEERFRTTIPAEFLFGRVRLEQHEKRCSYHRTDEGVYRTMDQWTLRDLATLAEVCREFWKGTDRELGRSPDSWWRSKDPPVEDEEEEEEEEPEEADRT